MSSKMSIIAPLLQRWLARYVPPTHLRNDEAARSAEIDAVMRAVLQLTPNEDIERWFSRVTARIDAVAQTSAWPRVAVITEHCRAVNRDDYLASGSGARPTAAIDTFEINARRINGSEPVSEHWLWGRNAVRLVKRGMVSEDRIDQRRATFAAALREIYGDEIAERMIAERNESHGHAERVEAATLADWQTGRRGAAIPDKRSPDADRTRREA